MAPKAPLIPTAASDRPLRFTSGPSTQSANFSQAEDIQNPLRKDSDSLNTQTLRMEDAATPLPPRGPETRTTPSLGSNRPNCTRRSQSDQFRDQLEA